VPEPAPIPAPKTLSTLLRNRGTRPFYQVRVGADTRAEADALCGRIRKAGGSCLVLRNQESGGWLSPVPDMPQQEHGVYQRRASMAQALMARASMARALMAQALTSRCRVALPGR
jgi:hypothetical protein